MTQSFGTLVAGTALALLLGSGLWAQDATPTPTPAATGDATTTEPAGTEPPRSLGEDVADPNAVGTIYIKEASGDWNIRCIRTEDGNDPCQLHQLLIDGNGNNVAEITMVGLPPGEQAAAGATITTPLGTLLTEQVVVQIDSGDAKRYPFTWCDGGGCYARIGFTQDGLAALKKGNAAKVTVVPLAAPDQPVVLTLSLKGFTAGFDKMAALNDAVAAAQASAPTEPATPEATPTPAP